MNELRLKVLAAETQKLAKEKAAKEKIRFEKSQAERVEMVRHLKMDMKLRDEDEIANERREGTSMSKGGKDEMAAAWGSPLAARVGPSPRPGARRCTGRRTVL